MFIHPTKLETNRKNKLLCCFRSYNIKSLHSSIYIKTIDCKEIENGAIFFLPKEKLSEWNYY